MESNDELNTERFKELAGIDGSEQKIYDSVFSFMDENEINECTYESKKKKRFTLTEGNKVFELERLNGNKVKHVNTF